MAAMPKFSRKGRQDKHVGRRERCSLLLSLDVAKPDSMSKRPAFAFLARRLATYPGSPVPAMMSAHEL